MEKQFMLVVVCERVVLFARSFSTQEKAIRAANKALENWIVRGKCVAQNMSELGSDKGDQWDFATETSLCAWANYCGDSWDAHIFDLGNPDTSVDVFAADNGEEEGDDGEDLYVCPACGGKIDPDDIDLNSSDEDGYGGMTAPCTCEHCGASLIAEYENRGGYELTGLRV